MRVILDQLITNLENGRPAVTGAIIRSTGSAPRGEGARMLVTSGGSLYGTIGGGELEGQSIAKAKTMLVESNNTDSSSRYQLLDFQLSTAEAALSGMVCGGSQQVLLQMIEPSGDNLAFFSELRDKFRNGLRPVLLTFVNGSDQPQLKMYSPDLELPAALRSDVSRKAENGGIPFTCEADGLLVFGEPLIKPKIVHFAGGGHVAQAAAKLAAIVGFRVRVMDDRKEFANRQLFPLAESVEVIPDFSDCLGETGPDDMVVIVTRGHLHDRDVLRQALQSRAGYIGMIGSRKKRDATYDALRTEGFTDKDFQRVHCPIGLNLGGDSPGEIGLSIIAELQQFKSGLSR